MAIFALKKLKNNLEKASKNVPKPPRKKLQKTQKSRKSLFFTDAPFFVHFPFDEGEVNSTRAEKNFDLRANQLQEIVDFSTIVDPFWPFSALKSSFMRR